MPNRLEFTDSEVPGLDDLINTLVNAKLALIEKQQRLDSLEWMVAVLIATNGFELKINIPDYLKDGNYVNILAKALKDRKIIIDNSMSKELMIPIVVHGAVEHKVISSKEQLLDVLTNLASDK